MKGEMSSEMPFIAYNERKISPVIGLKLKCYIDLGLDIFVLFLNLL